MKKIISIIIPIAVLAGLIWLSKPGDDSGDLKTNGVTASANSIVAEETSFDFGEISMSDGKVSHVFKLKNSDKNPVELSKLYTSCMCTSAEFIRGEYNNGPFGMPGHGFVPALNETVEPGQDFEVKVTFDPEAHGPAGVGPVNRIVYLEQKNGPKLQLQILGSVRP
ncbi:MAG: DUF1573 domain-containing protein [Candidatus Yanofskybacteria bacterium]|nr:DUF1573 domain-containing protein [Candidatus Yanofskybacteria bacterium]